MGRVGGGCVVVSVRCGQAVPLLLRCRVPASSGPGLRVSLCQVCVCGDRSVRPTGDEHSVHGGPRRRASRCAMQHRIVAITGIPQDVPTSQPGSIPHPVRAGNFAIAATARRARRRVSPSVASVGRARNRAASVPAAARRHARRHESTQNGRERGREQHDREQPTSKKRRFYFVVAARRST